MHFPSLPMKYCPDEVSLLQDRYKYLPNVDWEFLISALFLHELMATAAKGTRESHISKLPDKLLS